MCRAVTCRKMWQDHLGGLRPARQAGDGRCPGRPAFTRPRRSDPAASGGWLRKLYRPQLNRHHVTPRPPGPCATQRRLNWTMIL